MEKFECYGDRAPTDRITIELFIVALLLTTI